jgi:hypothetical protein
MTTSRAPLRRRRGLPLEVWLTAAAIAVWAGWLLRQSPVRFDGRPSEADRAEADKAVSAGEACVALTSNPAVASSLDDWNLDATWLNALEREVGKARVLEAGRLTRSRGSLYRERPPLRWTVRRSSSSAVGPSRAGS